MDVHPTKNVSIGIDPYPNLFMVKSHLQAPMGGVSSRVLPDLDIRPVNGLV